MKIKFFNKDNIYITLSYDINNSEIIYINNNNLLESLNQITTLFDYLYNINHFKFD